MRKQTVTKNEVTEKEGYIAQYKGKLKGWRKRYLYISREGLKVSRSKTDCKNAKFETTFSAGDYSVGKSVETNSKKHQRPFLEIISSTRNQNNIIEISSLSDEVSELEEWRNLILFLQVNEKKARRFAMNNNVQATFSNNHRKKSNTHSEFRLSSVFLLFLFFSLSLSPSYSYLF